MESRVHERKGFPLIGCLHPCEVPSNELASKVVFDKVGVTIFAFEGCGSSRSFGESNGMRCIEAALLTEQLPVAAI
jgi:hypothetical protein